MMMDFLYFIAIVVFIILSVGVLWYLGSISNNLDYIASELRKIHQSEIAKSDKLYKKRASL